MPSLDLDAIRERAEAARWVVRRGIGNEASHVYEKVPNPYRDVLLLLAEIERLTVERDKLTEAGARLIARSWKRFPPIERDRAAFVKFADEMEGGGGATI